MRLRRRHRLITMLFALISLLFMQLAVASYVCPLDSKAVDIAEKSMPCAGEMVVDTEQIALCHAHCQSDQQTVEKAQMHVPMGAVSTGMTYTIEPTDVDRSAPLGHMPSQLRTSAPPIAIRNCCFRI